MLAVSANGALGHAGLLLILAASCIGALSTGLAIDRCEDCFYPRP